MGEREEGHEGQELEGTGMAEGQGSKDVSDQIEDEEQIAGLQVSCIRRGLFPSNVES